MKNSEETIQILEYLGSEVTIEHIRRNGNNYYYLCLNNEESLAISEKTYKELKEKVEE